MSAGRHGAWLFAASAAAALLATAALYRADAPLRAGLGSDALHHMAAVRELAKCEFPPRHNLVVAPGLPQGHYGPYLVALGWIARAMRAEPLKVLLAAGVVNLFAYLLAFRRLTLRLGGDGPAAWAGLAPVLLWGPWPGLTVAWPSWRWPGTTSLAEVQNFFYPQQAGLVLLLFVLALLVSDAPERRLRAAILLLALLIATHPLTGLAVLPGLFAVGAAAVLRREASLTLLAGLVALPLAALVVAALWPFYPVLGLLKAASTPGLRETASASAVPLQTAAWTPILSILGPAVIGAWGALELARSRRPMLLVWTLATLAMSACPWLPLRERFVFFAAVPLQIGAAVALDHLWARPGWLGRGAAVALLAAGALSASERIAWLLHQEVPDLSLVARLAPESAIVLSDPDTSNGIAGLTGRKVVAPQHPDLFLVAAGGWQRVVDVQRFLASACPPEERAAILDRWHATHVLVDRLAYPGVELAYPVVGETGGYRLYRVTPLTPPS